LHSWEEAVVENTSWPGVKQENGKRNMTDKTVFEYARIAADAEQHLLEIFDDRRPALTVDAIDDSREEHVTDEEEENGCAG
jgi:hypothetical protein